MIKRRQINTAQPEAKSTWFWCERDQNRVPAGKCLKCKKAKSKKGCADYNEYLYGSKSL